MHSDNQGVVELAVPLFGSQETTQAYLKYCFWASRDLVKANWRAIEAVAAVLLERGTLNREEVIEVISPGSAVLGAKLAAVRPKEATAPARA